MMLALALAATATAADARPLGELERELYVALSQTLARAERCEITLDQREAQLEHARRDDGLPGWVWPVAAVLIVGGAAAGGAIAGAAR